MDRTRGTLMMAAGLVLVGTAALFAILTEGFAPIALGVAGMSLIAIGSLQTGS